MSSISLPSRQRLHILSGFLALHLFLSAANLPGVQASEKDQTIPFTEHLSLGIKTRLFAGSHTSFEFGSPFPPFQAPLSRLEFPLNSWWAGAALRLKFSRFSLDLEGLTNLSQEADGLMRDTDWGDDADPALKTIYSESKTRLDPSYMVNTGIDLKISDWLGLPAWFDLRPVLGFRWQDFNLVTHDGTQIDLVEGNPPTPLAGDGIRFNQTYRQYFLGLRTGIELGKYVRMKRLTSLLQLDWAYVEGKNQDHHLLREGARFTFEDTSGHAWHGSLELEAGLLKHLSLLLQADILRISTTGSHRIVNDLFDLDLAWSHGVKVWSTQNSISLMLLYAF